MRYQKVAASVRTRVRARNVPAAQSASEMHDGSLPLTPIQQGMLFHHLSMAGRGHDLEQIQCTLREPLDRERLRDAWHWLRDRHAALRRRVETGGAEGPHFVALESSSIDLRFLDATTTLDELLEADRREGFELTEGPLWRVSVLSHGEEHHDVVFSFHHILFDGRSFPDLLTEVFRHYDGDPLPETAPVDASHAHAAYLAGRAWDRGAETFWRATLEGVTAATPLPARRHADESPQRLRPQLHSATLSEAETLAVTQAAREAGVTVATLVQTAWALALGRGRTPSDVVFGTTRACRRSSVEGAEETVGVFINTVPTRVRWNKKNTVRELLQAVRSQNVAAREHEHTPLVEIQQATEVPAGEPLFDTNIVFDNYLLGTRMRRLGGRFGARDFVLHESAPFALTLYGNLEDELLLRLAFSAEQFDEAAVAWVLESVRTAVCELGRREALDQRVHDISLLSAERVPAVLEAGSGARLGVPPTTVPELFSARAAETPDAPALSWGGTTLTYRELDDASTLLARVIADRAPSSRVIGLCVERGLDLVIGALAILKAGKAYLPLDPGYPLERLRFMLEDSGVELLVADDALPGLESGSDCARLDVRERSSGGGSALELPAPEDLAYVIYTSGSTGRPKGVMVEHRNVVHLFEALDVEVPDHPQRTWLAVTSLSFDISVLEIFWTLCRGTHVVLGQELGAAGGGSGGGPTLSLMYFAADRGDEANPYQLLLEGAEFADRHGFEAVWMPERHFHDFGGLYPNPSVAAAAVAARTTRVAIRAGSVVSPLHHPARIAEEWSMVDNLSGGRVGLSFASGWHPNDFALRPEGYEGRAEAVTRDIETVRRLWRGEAVSFPGPKGDVELETLPRPKQSELPCWLTTAGNPETYRRAGEVGAHVLTHLLGQSAAELQANLDVYRKAWRQAGHPGRGRCTLMLHTLVGESSDAVREIVREPMKAYLRSSLGLIRGFASDWSAYKRGARAELSLDELSEREMEDLLDYSFERYFETSALFGSLDEAEATARRLRAECGVDEIACLVDFGVPFETTVRHFDALAALQERLAGSVASRTLADELEAHEITHLQCTPSYARILLLDDDSRAALSRLDVLLLGGEALPLQVAKELCELCPETRIFNMYGPTETTVWSTVQEITGALLERGEVPIGHAIANTDVYVLDAQRRVVPPGTVGDLFLAGLGVVRGYWNREELTRERFLEDPFRGAPHRMYSTGDQAHFDAHGVLHFDGRTDFQVKLRGHRIELGEIETVAGKAPHVQDAVVLVREDTPGDQRLVAYLTGEAELSEVAVRDHIAASLPAIMVPSDFVRLDAWPLTPNGKIDRKALPSPAEARESSGPAASISAPPPAAAAPTETPRADLREIEAKIAAIWSDVLARSDVGLDENFFDLGGHSLLAVRAHRDLKEQLGTPLQITDLFRFPTVRALAAHLGRQSPPQPAAEQEASDDKPKTASQRRAMLRRQRRQRAAR